MTMKKLRGLSDKQIEQISHHVADTFFDYKYSKDDDGLLYTTSDNQEGTDDKDKCERYVHLGMKLDRVRKCGDRFHMYDLIR